MCWQECNVNFLKPRERIYETSLRVWETFSAAGKHGGTMLTHVKESKEERTVKASSSSRVKCFILELTTHSDEQRCMNARTRYETYSKNMSLGSCLKWSCIKSAFRASEIPIEILCDVDSQKQEDEGHKKQQVKEEVFPNERSYSLWAQTGSLWRIHKSHRRVTSCIFQVSGRQNSLLIILAK